jgi:hypothetical protein
MATTTPNFGWAVPTSTDLVKDGAVAIETLGDSIDASLVDLKGGTTGQVLAKASNTDMDFTWSAAPSSSANWTLLNSGGTALTGAQTVTVSGISGKDQILVIVSQASSATAGALITLRLNTDTGSNYYAYGYYAQQGNPNVSFSPVTGAAANVPFGGMDQGSAGSPVSGYALISGCNTSGVKALQVVGSGETYSGTANMRIYTTGGYYNSSSTISSISIFSSTGNLDNGTVFVYTTA